MFFRARFAALSGLSERCRLDLRGAACRFLGGRAYPAVIAVLVVIGHIFAVELYTNILICISSALGFLLLDSARHFILPLCAYIYQISVKYAPGMPSYSDHNFSGVRGLTVVLLLFLLFSSVIAFSVRCRLFSMKKLLDAPLFIPSAALAVALALNGVLGGEWRAASLGYGVAVALSWFLVFYFFLFAFEREDADELLSYFLYVTALITAILVVETADLYLFRGVVGPDGVANKEAVLYGWGIWATAGVGLAVLIPTLLLGAMHRRHPLPYMALAITSLVAIALNLSRGALLVGALVFAVGMVTGCFCGRRRRLFRAAALVGGSATALGVALFFDRLRELLRDYFDRGFSDNGRLALWKYGAESFFDAPLFGKGFFGLQTDTFQAIELIPQMLHNTPVQIAASMGVFGLLAYGAYRVKSLRHILRRPTVEKCMVGLSMLALLLSSLFDNFIFYIQPMFYYSVEFALVCRLNDVQMGADSTPRKNL